MMKVQYLSFVPYNPRSINCDQYSYYLKHKNKTTMDWNEENDRPKIESLKCQSIRKAGKIIKSTIAIRGDREDSYYHLYRSYRNTSIKETLEATIAEHIATKHSCFTSMLRVPQREVDESEVHRGHAVY